MGAGTLSHARDGGLRPVLLLRRRTEAVKNVSVEIRRDEILALIGPSGCGKTTFLARSTGFSTSCRARGSRER